MSKLDIGTVKSLTIDVLTETGWFDDVRFKQNMADYGGAAQSLYRVAWDPENAGGYAALLTLTSLDGDERKILLDTGWNNDWMDCFRPAPSRPDAGAGRDRFHGALALAP